MTDALPPGLARSLRAMLRDSRPFDCCVPEKSEDPSARTGAWGRLLSLLSGKSGEIDLGEAVRLTRNLHRFDFEFRDGSGRRKGRLLLSEGTVRTLPLFLMSSPTGAPRRWFRAWSPLRFPNQQRSWHFSGDGRWLDHFDIPVVPVGTLKSAAELAEDRLIPQGGGVSFCSRGAARMIVFDRGTPISPEGLQDFLMRFERLLGATGPARTGGP